MKHYLTSQTSLKKFDNLIIDGLKEREEDRTKSQEIELRKLKIRAKENYKKLRRLL